MSSAPAVMRFIDPFPARPMVCSVVNYIHYVAPLLKVACKAVTSESSGASFIIHYHSLNFNRTSWGFSPYENLDTQHSPCHPWILDMHNQFERRASVPKHWSRSLIHAEQWNLQQISLTLGVISPLHFPFIMSPCNVTIILIRCHYTATVI
jgi:hypothetical protein